MAWAPMPLGTHLGYATGDWIQPGTGSGRGPASRTSRGWLGQGSMSRSTVGDNAWPFRPPACFPAQIPATVRRPTAGPAGFAVPALLGILIRFKTPAEMRSILRS